MKISKLFHWLYASVMFLPLVIIPLFGIWTINHDHNEPISVDVKQNLVVDFNQQINTNIYSSTYTTGNNVVTFNENILTLDVGSVLPSYTLVTLTPNLDTRFVPLINSHKYYVSYVDAYTGVQIMNGWSGTNYNNPSIFTANTRYFYIGVYFPNGSEVRTYEFQPVLIDLTQMFGVGNEPTLSTFQDLYSNIYYPYNTGGTKELLKDVSIASYSETDIGSQFLYTLYNSTDKYLNFDEVLNLGAISDWINQNVFNGNAPLVFYIVWHYLDYWLILSIFWLCFDVLIYVPQIAHRWLDKASLE